MSEIIKQENALDKWYSIEKDGNPEDGIEVLLFNEKWIDEDFNPNGTRVGFKDDITNWTSAYYSNYKDCYFTMQAVEDDPNFGKAEDEVPTHWRYIFSPLKQLSNEH